MCARPAKSNLVLAIEGLTEQLRIYNQRCEPTVIKRKEAEYFIGGNEAEQAKRDLHESLQDLEAKDRERRAQAGQKRRRA